jgi:hypothetical protein
VKQLQNNLKISQQALITFNVVGGISGAIDGLSLGYVGAFSGALPGGFCKP